MPADFNLLALADAGKRGLACRNRIGLPMVPDELLRIRGSGLVLVDKFREADGVKFFDGSLQRPARIAY